MERQSVRALTDWRILLGAIATKPAWRVMAGRLPKKQSSVKAGRQLASSAVLKRRNKRPAQPIGGSMCLRSVFALVVVCFVCSSGSVDSKNAAEQPDIGRSGSKFLEICSDIDNQPNGDPVRVQNDANCLGWVEGFGDGFNVHDELLGVPERDRMVCMPRAVTTVQIVRVIKKYLGDNPDKAHRATRYVASLALARAFPCKAGK
jgi:Rap1a immunity proteins